MKKYRVVIKCIDFSGEESSHIWPGCHFKPNDSRIYYKARYKEYDIIDLINNKKEYEVLTIDDIFPEDASSALFEAGDVIRNIQNELLVLFKLMSKT